MSISNESHSMTFNAKVATDENINNAIAAEKAKNKYALALIEDLEGGAVKLTFKYRVMTEKEYTPAGIYFKKTFVSWAA